MADAINVKVDVKLDQRAITAMTARVGDASAGRAAARVRDRAKAKAPVDTGRLRDSIHARRTQDADLSGTGITAYRVGSTVPYAGFQEHGVRGPILPRKAKVLRFKPKGSGVFIFRPRTRGVPAVHFLRDAYRSITARDFLP